MATGPDFPDGGNAPLLRVRLWLSVGDVGDLMVTLG